MEIESLVKGEIIAGTQGISFEQPVGKYVRRHRSMAKRLGAALNLVATSIFSLTMSL
jgi:hypothetical protein